MAACSCCSVDQACYSCTYQRLRSRQNLGVLPGFDGHFPGLEAVDFDFVNIRESMADMVVKVEYIEPETLERR